MDYSQLSDFEINKLVAYALGNADVGRPFDEISGTACRFTLFKNSGLNREGEIVMRPMTVTKDFCNNPADAWPIIVSNQISLMYEEAIGKWCAGKPYWVDGCEWQLDVDVMDENPLRAAMIFFLMMQAAKNA